MEMKNIIKKIYPNWTKTEPSKQFWKIEFVDGYRSIVWDREVLGEAKEMDEVEFNEEFKEGYKIGSIKVMKITKKATKKTQFDHREFDIRLNALRNTTAFCQGNSRGYFWKHLEEIEKYLRDGTRPEIVTEEGMRE